MRMWKILIIIYVVGCIVRPEMALYPLLALYLLFTGELFQ